METCCDFCAYNKYDEDDEEYYCSVNMEAAADTQVIWRDLSRAAISAVRFTAQAMNTGLSVTRCEAL